MKAVTRLYQSTQEPFRAWVDRLLTEYIRALGEKPTEGKIKEILLTNSADYATPVIQKYMNTLDLENITLKVEDRESIRAGQEQVSAGAPIHQDPTSILLGVPEVHPPMDKTEELESFGVLLAEPQRCFRCSNPGHVIKECRAKPFCSHCNSDSHAWGRCRYRNRPSENKGEREGFKKPKLQCHLCAKEHNTADCGTLVANIIKRLTEAQNPRSGWEPDLTPDLQNHHEKNRNSGSKAGHNSRPSGNRDRRGRGNWRGRGQGRGRGGYRGRGFPRNNFPQNSKNQDHDGFRRGEDPRKHYGRGNRSKSYAREGKSKEEGAGNRDPPAERTQAQESGRPAPEPTLV